MLDGASAHAAFFSNAARCQLEDLDQDRGRRIASTAPPSGALDDVVGGGVDHAAPADRSDGDTAATRGAR